MILIFFTMKFSIIHAYLIGLNLVTFLAYGFDKRQAIKSKGRVPEIVLHLLALVGGSPAAAIGQLLFRHKTKKPQFRIIFIMIVILQVTAILTAIHLASKAA
jgi:uncharacterized membrane protein YsdA (DUF1294 family)